MVRRLETREVGEGRCVHVSNDALKKKKRRSCVFNFISNRCPNSVEQLKYREDSSLSRISDETLVGHKTNFGAGNVTLINDIEYVRKW